MAVQEGPTFKRYAANGVTTVFSIPFLLLDAGDLVVTLNDIPVTSGFTLTGVGGTSSTATFAVAPTGDLLFRLVVPFQRLFDYQENGDFLADTVNGDFDRIWLALKELRRFYDRALKVSDLEPEGVSDLPSIAERIGKLLSFDAFGNPIAIAADSQSATELALDFANTTAPTKGAGIPAFNRDLAYQAASVGEELNLINRSRAIAVIDFGLAPDGVTDQTAAIQAVINQYDGAGKFIRILVADNIKFTLKNLTHNATSDLSIEYRFNDDLAFPNSAVGGSQQRMIYLDSGVSGISDNVMGYESAPYHPARILDMRSEAPSSWVSAAQRRTPINGSYIISREGYTRLQLTYRDFDLDGSDNPDTNARKSGIDFSLWRAQWTITGITSASWGAPPAEGNIVETADGRLFVVRFIDGAGMVLYHRKGNIEAGDTLIFNGVASSTTVTGTPARVLTSLLNRMCVSGYDGAVGFNMPPERVRNVNIGMGGILGLEKGSASLYGTSDPAIQCFDVLSAPSKGFYQKYNVTTGAWELYTHANVLMATISATGTMQLAGGVAPNVYSAAQLNSAAHAVNTDLKRQGKMVIRVTDSRPVYATGSAATATWVFSDGTLAHTPV